jgi:hypothetical protein
MERFFYDSRKLEYFDIEEFKFVKIANLTDYLCKKPKELQDMRKSKEIPTYKGLTYRD